LGWPVCPSGLAETMDEAKQIAQQIGSFPLIIRPAYTMGGTGGGIAYNQEEFETIRARAWTPARVPDFDRAIAAGLERVRAGGDARPGG
jgi:carbamoylphosphate synthase large subunit